MLQPHDRAHWNNMPASGGWPVDLKHYIYALYFNFDIYCAFSDLKNVSTSVEYYLFAFLPIGRNK